METKLQRDGSNRVESESMCKWRVIRERKLNEKQERGENITKELREIAKTNGREKWNEKIERNIVRASRTKIGLRILHTNLI